MLQYGLEIASRNANTKEVDSVRCKFCLFFGKEGRKAPSSAPESIRKRKVTDNIKYFTRPFRVDNYKSHLRTHTAKWAEYQVLPSHEKEAFFDKTPDKFINTLSAHYDIERNANVFCIDTDIVDKIIGEMLFDLDDDEDIISKERALSMFSKSVDTGMYTVNIKI